MFLLESDGHPFAMFITAFDMGSHDVLQVLARTGRANVATTPPPPHLQPKKALMVVVRSCGLVAYNSP
jgi:hypothetical protein